VLVKIEKGFDADKIYVSASIEYEKDIERKNVKKMLLRRLCAFRGNEDGVYIYKEIWKLNNTKDIEEFYRQNITLFINTLYRVYTILKELDSSVNLVIEF